MAKKKKQAVRFETNQERVIRELKQLGYDLGMAAERAVESYRHLPDDTVSFDETESLSYFRKGEVVISLTGQDLLERDDIEHNLALFARALQTDVHTCILEVLNEHLG